MITQEDLNKLTQEDLKIIHNYIHKLYRINHKDKIKHINKRHYERYKPIKEDIKKINPIEFIR